MKSAVMPWRIKRRNDSTWLASKQWVNRPRDFFFLLLGMFLLSTFLSGCLTGGDKGFQSYTYKPKKKAKIRLALLPFDNISKDAEAGRAITSVAMTALLRSEDFEIIEPGEVTKVLRDLRIRTTIEGIDKETLKEMGKALDTQLILLGRLEDYGEARVSTESYPYISVSARLVNAQDGSILWAATATETGGDSVIVFDVGRVSTLSKLSQKVVGKLMSSLAHSRKRIQAALAPAIAPPTPAPTPEATATPTPTPAATTTPEGGKPPSLLSEGKGLPAVEGFTKSDEIFTRGADYNSLKGTYRTNGTAIEVTLIDYLTAEESTKTLKLSAAGKEIVKFLGYDSYSEPNASGYYLLNIAADRFGLILRGPPDAQETIEQLVKLLLPKLAF